MSYADVELLAVVEPKISGFRETESDGPFSRWKKRKAIAVFPKKYVMHKSD